MTGRDNVDAELRLAEREKNWQKVFSLLCRADRTPDAVKLTQQHSIQMDVQVQYLYLLANRNYFAGHRWNTPSVPAVIQHPNVINVSGPGTARDPVITAPTLDGLRTWCAMNLNNQSTHLSPQNLCIHHLPVITLMGQSSWYLNNPLFPRQEWSEFEVRAFFDALEDTI